MPRDLVVGNGVLLVNMDRNLNIRDLYYPHVGLHNHVGGHSNRIGIWTQGQFSWLDETWNTRLGYRDRTLTTDAVATNGRLGIELRFNDTVHPKLNILIRRVTVENLYTTEREFRLFFHHDFRIYETDIGDTVFFHPFSGSMIHYKRDCFILIGGKSSDGGIYEYASGIKEFGGAEGTWRDAEDGTLSMHPIDQGSVDSTVSFKLQIPGKASATLDLWIAVGRSLEEVVSLNAITLDSPADTLITESDDSLTKWLSAGATPDEELPSSVSALYERSLLVLRTQIDRCGGILAANDTDIMKTARAHYSYVWPRDGALVANALDLAGFGEPSRRFFDFCAGILPSDRPYFLQKYCPDGTLGASWHPWITNGEPEVPCQQDSTALVLWSIGKHYDKWKDIADLNAVYEDIVVPATNYIINNLDPKSGLPGPSYDLWEQWRGIHLFTCCSLFGALAAAVKLAMKYDRDNADDYRISRDKLKRNILERFYDQRLGRFVRRLIPNHIGPSSTALDPDPIMDSSMAGVFLFDLLPADDARVVSTMNAIYDRLWVRTPIGGLARYEDDYYFQASSDVRNVPGNPWFVSTLWMAEWYIATAKNIRDLEPALDLLHWTVKHASEAGLLAEQIHPHTGQPLSVMPLTWSHAAFVSAVRKYQAKTLELTGRKADKA